MALDMPLVFRKNLLIKIQIIYYYRLKVRIGQMQSGAHCKPKGARLGPTKPSKQSTSYVNYWAQDYKYAKSS